ncbi:perforin-1-like [Sphaerodactylus townsendi]|uniref:perforin-1-like n=1 Tax=Sphaerodactylus townsendi TaxID=933632 RepID=UPI00202609B2|nr:perforin-1-like [Sphaerodactylus townsendi]
MAPHPPGSPPRLPHCSRLSPAPDLRRRPARGSRKQGPRGHRGDCDHPTSRAYARIHHPAVVQETTKRPPSGWLFAGSSHGTILRSAPLPPMRLGEWLFSQPQSRQPPKGDTAILITFRKGGWLPISQRSSSSPVLNTLSQLGFDLSYSSIAHDIIAVRLTALVLPLALLQHICGSEAFDAHWLDFSDVVECSANQAGCSSTSLKKVEVELSALKQLQKFNRWHRKSQAWGSPSLIGSPAALEEVLKPVAKPSCSLEVVAKSRPVEGTLHQTLPTFYGQRFRVGHHQPLSHHFRRALKVLPPKYHRATLLEYHQLIETYGTHFITKLHLGGRVRDVTAVRECETALDGMNAEEVKDCLTVEASAKIGEKAKMDASYQKCEEMRNKRGFKGSFHQMYTERHTEIVGGRSHADLLFSDAVRKDTFQAWVEGLKTIPGLVSYSLSPIHTLVAKEDSRRESLRQAVSEYVTKRALWRNCTHPCPHGTQRSAHDPCSCVCPDNGNTNSMCCSKKRGLAKVTVTIKRASGLWGDCCTSTDAYVKLFFMGEESRTPTVWNTNNPVWDIHFNLGNIQLLGETSKLRVQVWDEDHKYDDDLLGACDKSLQSGEHQEVCYLNHGRLDFQYHLACGPHLGGQHCMDYIPQQPRYKGAFLQRMGEGDAVTEKRTRRPVQDGPG